LKKGLSETIDPYPSPLFAFFISNISFNDKVKQIKTKKPSKGWLSHTLLILPTR
jgi:hypothetical protein